VRTQAASSYEGSQRVLGSAEHGRAWNGGDDIALPANRGTIEVKDVKLEQKFAGYTKGPSWRSWSSEFRIVTTVANLWKFYSGYYRSPPITADMETRLDFQHLSDTAFAVLNRNVTENIKAALQRFIDTNEPAFFAWQYLESTYRSRDGCAQLILEGKLAQLQMKDGESIEDYLTRACTIRDE
jgi:hypothetical protein